MMLFWSAISFTEGCVVLFLLNGFYLMKAAILISHFIYWRLRGYFFTEWFLFNEGSYFDQPFHLLKVAWFFFTEWFLFNEGCYFDQPFHLLKAAWFFYLLNGFYLSEGCYFDQPFHVLKGCLVLLFTECFFIYLLKAAILISHFIYWRLLKGVWFFFLLLKVFCLLKAAIFIGVSMENTNTVVCYMSCKGKLEFLAYGIGVKITVECFLILFKLDLLPCFRYFL